MSAYIIGLLFLPGTLIHELAHGLMAMILLVPVGKMELWPKHHDGGLKLGSIQIAKTDPIRRFIIGGAPFLFGTGLILGAFIYAVQNNLFSYKLSVIVIGYIVFEIGNTMFSSRKDMEGALELFLVIIMISAILYFAGLSIPNINPEIILSNQAFIESLRKSTLFLTAPIGIDLVIISLLKLLGVNSR